MDMKKDKTLVKGSYSDKLFLLNFIASNYLGPDVYFDNPRFSWFHRSAKQLPPYTSNNLGSSSLSVSQLESLYYYITRNANSDHVVNPDLFYMYLKGEFPLPSSGPEDDHRQFTSFFPLSLHERKKYPSDYEIIKGIVLIDDPVTTFIKVEDLARFKYLLGIDDLRINANSCLSFHHLHQKGGQENAETVFNEKESPKFGAIYRRRRSRSNGSYGTLPKGVPPQEVKIVDIGENESAYFFRVALPGVQRDFCEFECDIKSSGEVRIEGTGSGGKTIRKRSRVFRMFIQQLWPTGPFTVSFKLPGPVDPRLFTPNFRNDGIFEGVVVKEK